MRLNDKGETQNLLDSIFVMSYNKLSSLKHYWSGRKSLSNRAIEKAISRDRFLTIISKLCFVPPEKSSKTYYIYELILCLKYTFSKYSQDSVFQSIDESLTKFKGSSGLKQYMPLKPIKMGIKLWLRCDATSRYIYIYDMNIYLGKEPSISTKS